MKQELLFYKKCFGELLFFEEEFQIVFEGKDIVCKNIIGPVASYQKNAYQFLYEEKGKLKKKLISRPNRKLAKYQPNNTKTNLFKDKRGHVWTKSNRAFNFTDSLNFKPYGRIETLEGICPHINSGNHTCEFCEFVWSVVKKKKRCVEKNISV